MRYRCICGYQGVHFDDLVILISSSYECIASSLATLKARIFLPISVDLPPSVQAIRLIMP